MRLAPFLAAMVAVFGAAASAQDDPRLSPQPIKGVIELFTSQGCSSCPAADRIFESYAQRTDLVALSLPVDYWDYIGWKDTLASPRNTERQRTYARARGDGAIYTPQIVVNGESHVVANRRGEIESALARGAPGFALRQAPVRFWQEGGAVVIQTDAAPPDSPEVEATIWLAVVRKRVEVAVKRGENAGKTLAYHNVVQEMTPVGIWKGQPLTIQLARSALLRPDTEAVAILLQKGDGGPIVGAAWMGPL